MKPKTKTKKPKKKLSSDERRVRREQAAHKRDVRAVFTQTGFSRLPDVADTEIAVSSTISDYDDCFVYENIVVLVEYTITASSNISTHLKSKATFYQKTLALHPTAIEYLAVKFKSVAEWIDAHPYNSEQYQIRILYSALRDDKLDHKSDLDFIYYFSPPVLNYFKGTASSIHNSARYELFDYFGLQPKDVGPAGLNSTGGATETFAGSALPEANSNLPKGFKVVSFYVSPAALLSRAYVLRREGWRDSDYLYQRLLDKKKINSIRDYLNSDSRAFLNNIIVTLPSDTKIIDQLGNTVVPSALTKTSPANIQIPATFNSIGLVDGQHRLFAYHEGGRHEQKISNLRTKLNLLATGVIYPPNYTEADRMKFESQLFVEINANQTGVRSDLIQAIELILAPYSEIAVAKRVLGELNRTGPLAGRFGVYSYEKGKIKTASVVSYGLRNIVKHQGDDSFFAGWSHPSKELLKSEQDGAPLQEYIGHAVTSINIFLGAVRSSLKPEQWTSERDIANRVLTTTAINGLIVCLRLLVENGLTMSFEGYCAKLKSLSTFSFSNYKSSQYGAMGRELYKKFFV